METRLCEYIVTIAEQGNVSKAAEKLYLTQSALNQQLLKLEKELGAPIFVRSRYHWTLTSIGKLYVENARKIIDIKKETYNQIEDMAQNWKRTISIGITPERGIQMFTSIYSDIHAKYPNTIFQPVEETVENQVKLLDANQIDIGFQTNYYRKYKHLTYKTILYEPFVLCVPDTHPLAYHKILPPSEFPTISLTEFKDDLFTLVKKTSNMRIVVDKLFEQAGFQPHLLFESVGMHIMQKLAANNQCCSIIPLFYAVPSDKVSYFLLGPEAKWELAVVYKPNHYLNQATKDFIQMASLYWQSHPYIE